jgi:hypothetical protein
MKFWEKYSHDFFPLPTEYLMWQVEQNFKVSVRN